MTPPETNAQSRTQDRIILLLRILLGIVLIWSSVGKIADPATFARDIDNYHLVPWGLENTMAIILPWLEATVGLGLILGIMVRGAALWTVSMMAVFIVAIGSALLRGYNIECGCGLKEGEMVGIGKLLEDVIYFFIGWVVYSRHNGYLEIFPKSD